MPNEETQTEKWHIEGDRLDGRHQFTIRDADGNSVLGVDATGPVLSGYGKEADDRSWHAEGHQLAWRRAQLAVQAPNLLRERDEARQQRDALADALETCRRELACYDRTDTGERVTSVTAAIEDAVAALAKVRPPVSAWTARYVGNVGLPEGWGLWGVAAGPMSEPFAYIRVRRGDEATVAKMVAALQMERALIDAVDDVGAMYAADEETCECGVFDERGTCWHVRGNAALEAAKRLQP